ncbi:MAG: SAM-dependent methyltransferase [Frankia sp.]
MIYLVSAGWDSTSDGGSGWTPPKIDTTTAHPARIYDYILGGKDNFPADRAAAEDALTAFPPLGGAMRANRATLHRAVRYLAAEEGVRQFLDIGTGIPTSPNVHEIAQSIDPTARIVYTDNDPIVSVHARALLTGSPTGATAYFDADLREPDLIVEKAATVLDLSQPVALLAFGILMFVPNHTEPFKLISQLMAPLASGSQLALTHPSAELHTPGVAAGVAASYARSGISFQFRTKDEIGRFFEDLDLVEPGIVPMAEWHPDSEPNLEAAGVAWAYAAVGRKP